MSGFGSAGCVTHHIRFLGGHEAVVRPVPIPNTAVKHSLADGSGFIDSARVGRRQFLLKGPKDFVSALLLLFARHERTGDHFLAALLW